MLTFAHVAEFSGNTAAPIFICAPLICPRTHRLSATKKVLFDGMDPDATNVSLPMLHVPHPVTWLVLVQPFGGEASDVTLYKEYTVEVVVVENARS